MKPKPAKPVTLWVDGAFPEAFADDILYEPKKGVRKVRYVPASSSSRGEAERYRRALKQIQDGCVDDYAVEIARRALGKGRK